MEALRPGSNLFSVCSVRQVHPTSRQQLGLLRQGSSTNVSHLHILTKLRRKDARQLATNGAVWRNGNCRHFPRPQASMAGSSDLQGSGEFKLFSFSTSESDSPSNELNDQDRAEEVGESLALTRHPAGTLERFKKEATSLFQDTKGRLESVSGQQLAMDALEFCGAKTRVWWKNTALWYKLPVAVFLSFVCWLLCMRVTVEAYLWTKHSRRYCKLSILYSPSMPGLYAIYTVPLFLFLRLFCGPVVAWELVPLWVLGPLLFGLTIWFYAMVYRISKRTAMITKTTTIVLSNRSVEFYNYASSGKLSEDLSQFSVKKKEQLEEKGKQVFLLTSGKKDALVKYVESGQIVEDASEKAKEIAKKRGEAFEEWLVRTYEDVIDWWRPTRRAILKLLQKVF